MKRSRHPFVGALLMVLVLLLIARCSAEAECEAAGGQVVISADGPPECIQQ